MNLKPDSKDWVEFVLERFIYNYKSETVHWRSAYSEDGCGAVITGCLKGRGYLQLRVCGRPRLMHHIVWILVTGKKPELDLDHIDGNGMSNSHKNLREVNRSINMHNTAGKGYCWHKGAGKWSAQVTVGYKKKHLGLFRTEEEARAAYEAAKKTLGFTHR